MKEDTLSTTHWTTGRLLSTAARLDMNRQNRQLADHSVTEASAVTLRTLSRSGPISQSGLADLVHVQAQTMGTILGKLERKGLVSRVRDPANRRVRVTAITDEGTHLITRIEQEADGPPGSTESAESSLRNALISIITSFEASASSARTTHR